MHTNTTWFTRSNCLRWSAVIPGFIGLTIKGNGQCITWEKLLPPPLRSKWNTRPSSPCTSELTVEGGGEAYAISKGEGANLLFGKCFVENCIKTKEIGPPPLYRQWSILSLIFIIQQAFPVSNLDKVFNSNGKTTVQVWVSWIWRDICRHTRPWLHWYLWE